MSNVKSKPISIPWSPPLLGEDDKQAAIDVIKSGWMTQGKQVAALEEEMAAECGAKHAIVVDHGTSALMAALIGHGIGEGDEVLVPTMTFIATVNAVSAVGATPVLVDCDPKTLNVTPELLRAKITKKTRAILFVDVYGMPCDIDAISELAREYELDLIEDAAEAIGATYKGRQLGESQHTVVISFHMAKLVACVEGGCILTNDDEMAHFLKQVRNHGMAGRYDYKVFGLNFRMTDIQAAMGRTQLKKLPLILEHRQNLVKQYKEGLKGLVEFQEVPDYVTSHPHMIFSIFLKDQGTRDGLIEYLNANGIDTRVCWLPTHQQPYHKEIFANQSFPNAEALARTTVSPPLGNALSSDEVATVIDVIKEGLTGGRL